MDGWRCLRDWPFPRCCSVASNCSNFQEGVMFEAFLFVVIFFGLAYALGIIRITVNVKKMDE